MMSVNINQLMHPENLSNVELVRILQSLCVSEPLDSSRSHIIDIFKKVAVPLPPRQISKMNAKLDPKSKDVLRSFINSSFKRELPVNVYEIDQNIKKMKLNFVLASTKELHVAQDKLNNLHISDTVTDERRADRSNISSESISGTSQETNSRKSTFKRKFLYEFDAHRKQKRTSGIRVYYTSVNE